MMFFNRNEVELIQDSRAADLAKMMKDSGKVFPGFFDLLIHEKWPIRLGAMVTFEHLVEENKVLSSQIIALLWDRFPNLDDPIKGDVLHLLGESCDATAIPMLQSIIQGDYPADLKEAAQEVLVNLESTSF
jgi:hypothetical protein